ncbi:MAG: hypothetical protein RIT81_14440 [Deltaproteobacteria bacterium]
MNFPSLSITSLLRTASLVAALGASACSGGGDDGKTPSGCTSGVADSCPSGQICNAAGTCEPTSGVAGALVIDSAGARACEILLASSGAAITRATYGTGVTGAMRARPPRVAIAVSSDQAFGADAIQLEIDGATSDLSVSSIDCYDASGAPLSSASASID